MCQSGHSEDMMQDRVITDHVQVNGQSKDTDHFSELFDLSRHIDRSKFTHHLQNIHQLKLIDIFDRLQVIGHSEFIGQLQVVNCKLVASSTLVQRHGLLARSRN